MAKARSDDELAIFYKGAGGRPIFMGGDQVWDFGWRPPEIRTAAEKRAEREAVAAMPVFKLKGKDAADDESQVAGPMLLWRHPAVKAALGFEFGGVWQAVGSCVGAGGGNVLFSLLAAEVIRLKDPEKIAVPFWPLTWGKSRERGGMNDRGDGSFGGTFAEAARLDGTVDATGDGLPAFNQRAPGWLWWGADAELDWSQGRRMPAAWLAKAKLHVVKTTAPCRDHNDVKAAVRNYFPVTCASMWGMRDPRSAKVEGGMLTAKRSGSWAHQMSIQAHVSRGGRDWYFLHNQWGPDTYGRADPLTEFAGGVWIDSGEVDWICRAGEVFAFSQFSGFPADYLDPGSIV